MTCEQFLARYSEFVDNRMALPDAARMRRHARECESCAGYHRVVSEGRDLLDDLERVEPSPDFRERLEHRLAGTRAAAIPAARRAAPGALATLSIAALIAAIAWSPLLRDEAPLVELPAMAARAPAATRGVFVTPLRFFAPGPGDAVAEWWRGAPSDVGYPSGVRPAAGAALSNAAFFESPASLDVGAAFGIRTALDSSFE